MIFILKIVMSQNFTVQSGILVFVEGNKKEDGLLQKCKNEFFKVMEFGTMKSWEFLTHMLKLQFLLHHTGQYVSYLHYWGPVYIENIHTKKKREVKYFQLYKTHEDIEYKLSNINCK